jgi:hypothetical protein
MGLRFIIIICLFITSSCYTLNGISIPDNVESYYVDNFKIKARNAPPLINQIFTEDLKNKINSQTKLVANNEQPDIEFTGEITRFDLQALAPTRDQESSLNRLNVSIAVEFVNNKDDEASWKQTFSQNYDFSADKDLLSIQDQAIAEIYEQIIEQIFNKSFANW